MTYWRSFWAATLFLVTLDAAAISIDLKAAKPSIMVGETLAITVSVSGLAESVAPSMGVYDLDINFDSDRFNVEGITWGDATLGNQLDLGGAGSFQLATRSLGAINLFELSFDDQLTLNNLQAGEFTLFSILLKATAVGQAHFALWVNAVGDAVGNNLDVSGLHDLSLGVHSVNVSEPSGSLLLLGVLAIILLRVRRSPSP